MRIHAFDITLDLVLASPCLILGWALSQQLISII